MHHNPHPAELVTGTLTTREVAQMLGLAVRSVQLMVDRGELQAWKTAGGHRRILARSVQEWISRSRGRGAAQALAALDGPDRLAQGASTPPEPGPRPPKVLLIEDSVHFQRVLGLMIRSTQPDVALYMADDAVVGLALCGEVRPDVIIVDLLLPGIDGAALISSLRSQPYFGGMQVMVVTALSKRDRAPYAYALAGIPVVGKNELVRRFASEFGALLARVRPLSEAEA